MLALIPYRLFRSQSYHSTRTCDFPKVACGCEKKVSCLTTWFCFAESGEKRRHENASFDLSLSSCSHLAVQEHEARHQLSREDAEGGNVHGTAQVREHDQFILAAGVPVHHLLLHGHGQGRGPSYECMCVRGRGGRFEGVPDAAAQSTGGRWSHSTNEGVRSLPDPNDAPTWANN